MSFVQALPIVLEREGGFVDHEADRGGATNRGVTQAVYDTYRTGRSLETRSVREITDDEVEEVYLDRYWVPAQCDALPWPVSLLHFDASVNHGLGRKRRHPRGSKTGSVHLLQRAVGVDDDGAHGPITQAAIGAADPALLARDYLLVRLRYYHDIVAGKRSQRVFLLGWVARINELFERIASPGD